MEIGIGIFPTAETIRPDVLALAAENLGFGALWVPEHTHIPVDHSPYPAGGPLPDFYRRTFDPFLTLTAAATVTSRLRLATGVCLLAQRDPIITAKEVASLDVLSGGRMRLGVWYGWNRPEAEHHRIDFDARRAIVHERILAMKALWTQEEASFDGEHVRFAASTAWPKPVQQPHPPVVLGAAAGPRTFARLIDHCDGWAPIPGRGGSLNDLAPRLWQACEDAGRDPATMPVWAAGAKPDPAALERYAATGLAGAFFWLPQAPESEVLERLADLAELSAGYG